MAKIKSFAAIRPPKDKAHLVATRPYYTYKQSIIEAKLRENPYTFMHIIKPEHGLSEKTVPNSDERFKKVRSTFDEFLEKEYLEKEGFNTLYVYRQTKNNKSYTGIIAGASVKEYEANKIKKHEATLTSREEVFVNYLEITGFNAEPVLLSYRPHSKIKTILTDICSNEPMFDFSTTDMVQHELWIVEEEQEITLKSHFEEIENLYIADGHHRSASSTLLAQKHRTEETPEDSPINFFLAYLLDETELDIFPFHRFAKDLNGLTKEEFLAQLINHFVVEKSNVDYTPKRHEILLVFHDDCYKLSLKTTENIKSNPVKQLDTQILTDFILDPMLNIKDLKTDNRIDFVSGENGIENLIEKIDKNKSGVGFILAPIAIDEVKAVADAELIMPPKSTWVEPKLRSGLIIYPIFND